jgi:CoA:oxalate CoA-transferase
MGLPLDGVRVLDLSQELAGPFGSMILGDLGAEVIKIEPPGRGDVGRDMPPHHVGPVSVSFQSFNRNKKSVTLDLEKDEGLELFHRLVEQADIVWDDFRPGVLERRRCDFQALAQINPRIICCSVSGYGQTGPYRDRPAGDLVIQARGGIMSYTGEPGRMPVRMGAPIGDMAGGMFAVKGVLAALYQRERTGRGQRIDVALLDCQVALMVDRAVSYLMAGEVATPVGSGHASGHPIRAFRTKTFPIVLDAVADQQFAELCRLVGHPELAEDPRFGAKAARFDNQKDLYQVLDQIFLRRSGEEWLALLEASVPVAPINTVEMALKDAQVLRRGMVIETAHPEYGTVRGVGNPIKTSEIEEEHYEPAPLLGEHTDAVLRAWLGLAPAEIAALRDRAVV